MRCGESGSYLFVPPIFVKKQEEPECLTRWKRRHRSQDYTALTVDVKATVRARLVDEQGGICCYCGVRIDENTCHIEHLKPQSAFPSLSLDYSNMLASCNGDRLINHCGPKKDRWYDDALMVNPLRHDCSDYFRFSADGRVLPSRDPAQGPAARETIDRLGLNVEPLKNMRKAAIAQSGILLRDISLQEARELLQTYDQIGDDNRFAPFCFVIVSLLREAIADLS